jgi:hypothetical protein
MTGVYVLTNDYLAVSVFDAPASPGGIRPGDRPGDRPPVGDRPPAGDRPVDRPAGAGQPGGATQPGTGTQPGGGIGAATGPQAKSHVSVILKRAGGPGRP